jgi:hypothetical protein
MLIVILEPAAISIDRSTNSPELSIEAINIRCQN